MLTKNVFFTCSLQGQVKEILCNDVIIINECNINCLCMIRNLGLIYEMGFKTLRDQSRPEHCRSCRWVRNTSTRLGFGLDFMHTRPDAARSLALSDQLMSLAPEMWAR